MILEILECTLWIWGFYALFQKPFLLEGIGKVLNSALPRFAAKPLFDCMVCMASVHGTLFYLLYVDQGWINWIVFIISVCGASFILKEIIYVDED